ncbi:MAG: TonB-dependent receptor, partial [Bacteroidetes bacterium]
MIYRLLLFCSLFLALGSLCIAQEKGVITGTVRNSETKEIITGANIRVEGTLLGSVSNIYGVFLINNLPVKTYTLIVSMLGFETKKVENIEASSRDTILLGGDITIELEPMPVQTQPVIVTASKREQNIEEIPASVSVIDSRLLTSRNSVAVDDALRYVSGVNFIQSQVNIRGSTGYSKGVGTRVLILVDGLPMLSGDTGEIIWESFPVSQIERVEIVKGAGSALFGSNALGGVINLITKSGSVTPETHLQVYGGVYESPYYDEWKWTDESRFLNGIRASHQQQFLNGSLFLAFNRTEDDGYQKNNHWTRWNGWAKLDALLSTDETLTMAVGILDQRRGNFLYWKDLQHALEPTDDQLAQKIESLRWTVSMMYKTIFSSQTFLTFKTSLFRTRWEDNIPHPYDADGERSEADNKNGEIQIVHQVSENNIVTGGLYGNINTVDSDSIFGKHSGRSVAAY